jgi:hypothetical protein
MGLFRSFKRMKDFSDERGGTTNVRDAFRDVGMVFDDRGEREILKTGASAMAIVKGVLMQVPEDRFAMKVPLEVHPPSGASYEITYVFPAARAQAGLIPGQEIPIKISKDDPQRVAVQWEAVKAEIAAEGGALAAAMKSLGHADPQQLQAEMMQEMGTELPAWMKPGTASTAGTPGSETPGAGGDVASRLQQLEELKVTGLITQSDYDAKKRQILADL